MIGALVAPGSGASWQTLEPLAQHDWSSGFYLKFRLHPWVLCIGQCSWLLCPMTRPVMALRSLLFLVLLRLRRCCASARYFFLLWRHLRRLVLSMLSGTAQWKDAGESRKGWKEKGIGKDQVSKSSPRTFSLIPKRGNLQGLQADERSKYRGCDNLRKQTSTFSFGFAPPRPIRPWTVSITRRYPNAPVLDDRTRSVARPQHPRHVAPVLIRPLKRVQGVQRLHGCELYQRARAPPRETFWGCAPSP